MNFNKYSFNKYQPPSHYSPNFHNQNIHKNYSSLSNAFFFFFYSNTSFLGYTNGLFFLLAISAGLNSYYGYCYYCTNLSFVFWPSSVSLSSIFLPRSLLYGFTYGLNMCCCENIKFSSFFLSSISFRFFSSVIANLRL